jgi:CHAT domain-containing protein
MIRQEIRLGQLDLALQNSGRAYEQYARTDPVWAWQFRVQKAHVLVLRGYYRDALSLLRETIPDSLAHSEVALRRKLIQGVAHDYSQEFEQADVDLNEATEIAKFQPMLVGDVYQARGNLETHRKNFNEASRAFHAALDFSRKQNLPYLEGNVLGSLGYLAMWQEHYDEAISWFKSALDKSQTLGTTFLAAKVAGNIGWNYSAIGDFDDAEQMLHQAIDGSAKAGLTADRVYWLNALGDVYYQQHRYKDADAISNQALSLARKMDNQRTIAECLNTLSEIALETGRTDLAENLNQEAAAVERAGLDHFGVHYSQIVSGRIALGKKEFASAEDIFQRILADPSMETPLKWEAESRLAQVYAAGNRPGQAEQEFLLALKTIREAQDSLQRDEFRLSFLNSAIQFYEAYIEFLQSRGHAAVALSIADLSRAQTLEHGLSLSNAGMQENSSAASPNPRNIAHRLNATLLFYWLGQRHSYLWAVTPSNVSLFTLPAAPEVDSTVKSYRQSFLDPRDPLESGNTDGKKLYDTLVRPVEKLISKSPRVIIFPDGSLNGLNFETLLVSGPQPHYWIEDVTISIANSLALLARSQREPPPKNATLLFFGDALSASKEFPPLPDSGKEADILKKYFPEPRRTFFTGVSAKASQYASSNPGRFSYLHFATHGTASLARPLESAIILSPEGDSFKLYARDIVEHPIHSFLVTISACDGAGKRVYAGEGLVGLSWAFLRAGAHNVVAGLWEVSNASTPQLMDELYKGVSAGQDPATALRNAKLSLLHSGGIYKKPFYWAPFQLYSGS